MIDTVIHDAREIVVGPAEDRSELKQHEDGAIAVVDGTIAAVGPNDAVTREYPPENAAYAIDASEKAIIPGFVDSHTHALFAGDRSDEFEAKLSGATYQEILAEGGGILRTVRATREATDQELLDRLLGYLDVMLAHGTTTVEVKSGYGLDTETELRMLSILDRADREHSVDVVPTFMGAHAVPPEYDSDEYTEIVIDEQLPAVVDQDVAEFCDVFCEEDVFSVEQSRQILEAGTEHGLKPKVHAEEFVHFGGAQLAAELEATSADHLLHADSSDIKALDEAGVAPVLLPGTAFSLGAEYADARAFLEQGVPVALASDFNPNCHSPSMQFAVALGCLGMEMTPAEAIVAATHGGARALDCEKGTLEQGAPADLSLIDAPSHVHIPYTFGINNVEAVMKGGEIVYDR